MLDKARLVLGRRLQLLAVRMSPWGCLSILTIWQLTSPRLSDTGEGKAKAM